jgi:hypothetical protein
MSEKSILDGMLSDHDEAEEAAVEEAGGSAVAEARAKARRMGGRKAVKAMASELDERRYGETDEQKAARLAEDRAAREAASSGPTEMVGLKVGDRFRVKGLRNDLDGDWEVARIEGGTATERTLWATRIGGSGAMPLRSKQLMDLVHSPSFRRL